MPTFAGLAGAPAPRNTLDGVNIWPLMTGETAVERPLYLYFNDYNLQCARLGRWKLHLSRFNGPAWLAPPAVGRMNLPLVNLELYDLDKDPEESYSAAADNPAVVAEIQARVNAMLPSMPDLVRSSWTATMNRPANPCNEGEWPTPR